MMVIACANMYQYSRRLWWWLPVLWCINTLEDYDGDCLCYDILIFLEDYGIDCLSYDV
jgi:hypothetical protein